MKMINILLVSIANILYKFVCFFYFVIGGYSNYGGNYNSSPYNNSTNNGNSNGPDWWGGWDK